MFYTFAVLFVLFTPTSNQLQLWESKASFDVVLSLQRLYHARCLHLVAPEDSLLASGPQIANVQKLMSVKGLFTAHIGLKKLNGTHRCRVNRPLNVIFGSEEETLAYLGSLDRVPPLPRWVAFLDGDPTAVLRGVNAEFDCEFLVVRAHARTAHASVSEAYRTQRDAPLRLDRLAEWTPDRGLDRRGLDLGARRSNLHGAKMRYPPLMQVTKRAGALKVTGFLSNVWKLLETELNFTTVYSMSPTGQTSEQLANGSWVGCVDAMQRRLADVTSADLVMTSDRTFVLRHLYPVFTTKNRYYMKEAASADLSWDNFLTPFSARLWLAVVSSVALLSLALLAAHRCGQRLGTEEAEGGALEPSLAVVYMLGLACGQGHDSTPNAASGRIVYQVGALTGIVVLAAYSAALISFLAVEVKEFPVNSFEDLVLADGRFKLGIRITSGQFTLLKTTEDPVLHQIYVKLLQPTLATLPQSDDEGLHRVCAEDNYGFLTYHEMIGTVPKLPCIIVPAPGIALPARFAFAAAKESPYHDVLNAHMLRLRHSGALHGLRWRYWPQARPTAKSDFSGVSIEQSTPIFVVFAVGVGLGVAVMLVERSSARWTATVSVAGDRARRALLDRAPWFYSEQKPGKPEYCN